MRFDRPLRFLLVTAIVALNISTALAQNDRRIARAARVEAVPNVDGDLSDAVWQSATAIDNFVQSEPVEGATPSEKTTVRILYTRDTLFVGVMCFDTEPDKIIVSDSRRDSGMDDTDSFQIILDTYHDRQNGFVFGTNPAGIEYDAQVTNEGEGGGPGPGGNRNQVGAGGGFNLNWDAPWRVATKTSDEGWAAEFEIPLRTLRYGDKPQTWGMNFRRNIRRKREEVFWSPIPRIYNLYRLSSAGELHGLEIDPPRNFKVTPYVVASGNKDFRSTTNTDLNWDADAGVDAKFGVTPSLNLDLTYNTDFAQVEVDEQQVNLTRFNLFFPEKRPFFLENAGLFAVGRGNSLNLFFSRRIGISPAGGLVPIVGGTRLTGKLQGFNLGLMNMQTKRAGITAANNFSVARLSRELPNRSSLGGIFVNRQATGDGAGPNNWNRAYALDGKLGIGRATTVTGFAAGSSTPNRTGDATAYDLRGEFQKTAGRTHFEYTRVGENFNPEVGFLERKAYESIDTAIFGNLRFRNNETMRKLFRELRPHASYNSFWDLSGFQETSRLHVDSHVDFENGYFFSPAVNRTVEGLKQPFEIFPGIVVPPGRYENWELAWRANTNQAAPASLNAELDWGGFLTGVQRSFGFTAAGRKGSNLNTSLRWRRNDIRLQEGAFKTNLIQWRINYSFTPLRYIQTLIQYNDRINQWSANVRLGLLDRASTGLFIVYNETQALEPNRFFTAASGPVNRSFVVKYTRQFDVLR